MSNFHTLYCSLSSDSQQRGSQFEQVCRWFLGTDPRYSNRLEKIWLWDDWPGRWGRDCGIDLVAKDMDGKIWAIQAKCYDPDYSITKSDVDKFLSESVHQDIDHRLLIATTDRMGENSKRAIRHQNEVLPVNLVLLHDLVEAPLVWPTDISQLEQGRRAEPASPRPHQKTAIEEVTSSLTDRGQMIMACGTGKTLTALWIAERLQAKRTLVLLPSLLLLSKTLRDWLSNAEEPFAYLPVCSDESAARGADEVISSTSELAFPSTTKPEDIAAFLCGPGSRVVFSTYQSSPMISKAFEGGRMPHFDLVIADEAHRCAGKVASEYGTVLDEKAIPAHKRLFMTATPRIYTAHLMKAAADSGIDVASMDDPATFGPVLHRLTFGQAIEKELLSDYQVVVVGVDDPTYQQMVSDRKLVETDTGLMSDARSLASHVGLAKAMQKYDLHRVITFHSRVAWASRFSSELSEVINWMPKEYRPDGEVSSSYVSGDMSTAMRNQRLASLAAVEKGQRAVLANARCLSEGVDVPALDGVAFIDPRKSEIDIVQAVGRAIRLSPDKSNGTIIIPAFISDADDPDVVLSGSEFDKVWKVVNALRAHDDALGEELDNLRVQLGRRGTAGRPTKIVIDIPIAIDERFAATFHTRLLEATTTTWLFWYGLLLRYLEREGHARVPAEFKTVEGYTLGIWVSNQRNLKANLSLEKVNLLESLPTWVWSVQDAMWEEGFGYLESFILQEGHARVRWDFRTPNGFALGSWVTTQRKKKGELSAERLARLTALPGWIWEPYEFKWDKGFKLLKEFVELHGHSRVPLRHKAADGYALGSWVHVQRRSKDKLTIEQIERLEALPKWAWSQRDAEWEEGFRHLKAFIDCEGNSRVSWTTVTLDGFSLGKWVLYQRGRYLKLPPERVAMLEALPKWTWNTSESDWDKAFGYLKEFVKREGHARVPLNHPKIDGFALGTWVAHQRKRKSHDKLTSAEIGMLEALPGWVWNIHDAQWERRCRELEAFAAENGHSRVPQRFKTSEGGSLGAWVGAQRRTKEKLTDKQIARLQSLPGWTWGVLDDEWEEAFDNLGRFVEQNGHARVPASFIASNGFRLGVWVSTQRAIVDKLSPERIARLESLDGWVWRVYDARWEESYCHLKRYVDHFGTARIPAAFKTEDGFALGYWVRAQRNSKEKLSAEQFARLEALPGWVWKVRGGE